MEGKIAIGVDIGGSHITCAAFDLSKDRYLDHTQITAAVDNHAEKEDILDTWARALNKSMSLAGQEKIVGIGFAMPGPFDYVNGISLMQGKNAKYEKTYGMKVPEEVIGRLHVKQGLKIRFINDATAFAIGESRKGKTQDCERSIALTLGTGLGSALLQNGIPVTSGAGVPENGCLWHLPYKSGIADDYFSTRGLTKRYAGRSGLHLNGVREIAERVSLDPHALSTFHDFGRDLGEFLVPVCANFQPASIVLGGNISNAYANYRESLLEAFKNEGLSIQVFKSDLMEKASLVGSAALLDDPFYQKVLPALKSM